MLRHEEFEELCAVRVIGQLEAEEEKRLVDHLAVCDSCRAANDDFSLLIRELPAPSCKLADHSLLRWSEERGLRRRFIARAHSEGVQFSREAQSEVQKTSWIWTRAFRFRPLLASGLCIIAVSGVLALKRRNEHRNSQFVTSGGIASSNSPSPHGSFNGGPVAQSVQPLGTTLSAKPLNDEMQIKSLLGRAETLEAELAIRRSENKRLEQTIEQFNATTLQMSNQANQNETQLQQARTELERAVTERTALQTDLVSAKTEVTNLSEQLRLQEAAQNRDRELLSLGRDISDLMGARNLHVIDVHDDDGRGKDKKSFGRVFYTEGKSLIFYAYDLDEKKLANARYTFQAWGEKLGEPATIKSLGLLYVDDKQQKRWVLKVDDPQQLAEIDSVFVTLEPHNSATGTPRGRRILYAFLGGEANHP